MSALSPIIQDETIHALVRRIFQIEDITRGDPKQNFIFRYGGRLLAQDSAQAYDQLAAGLAP